MHRGTHGYHSHTHTIQLAPSTALYLAHTLSGLQNYSFLNVPFAFVLHSHFLATHPSKSHLRHPLTMSSTPYHQIWDITELPMTIGLPWTPPPSPQCLVNKHFHTLFSLFLYNSVTLKLNVYNIRPPPQSAIQKKLYPFVTLPSHSPQNWMSSIISSTTAPTWSLYTVIVR